MGKPGWPLHFELGLAYAASCCIIGSMTTDKKRTPCPRCERSIAVIGKRGQLARHKCIPTPDALVREAEGREKSHRARLIAVRATRQAARAWVFRLLALGVFSLVADLAFAALGRGNSLLETAVIALIVVGVILNFTTGMRATRNLEHLRTLHSDALAAIESAQAAKRAAEIGSLVDVARVDLDALERP